MLRRMAAVSWDVHELLSQHNHYIDELLVVSVAVVCLCDVQCMLYLRLHVAMAKYIVHQ